MILLLDLGNTRMKWCLWNGQSTSPVQACQHEEAVSQLGLFLQAHPLPIRALGCTVTEAAHGEAIGAMLAALGIPLYWQKPRANCLGMRTTYNINSLGADRWLSLLAAWQKRAGDVLVINAGTALTVDALTDAGDYLGGTISPGWQLMRQALATGTARLGRPDGQYAHFPDNTADAIHTGILAALRGPIEQLARKLAATQGQIDGCFLSGGDAELIHPILNITSWPVDNLVLEGLAALARHPQLTENTHP